MGQLVAHLLGSANPREYSSAVRHEIKFVGGLRDHARIHAWMRLHPLAFRRAYATRVVNNIYFDSLCLLALDENLSGISDRVKVRARWYGERWSFDRCRVELKRRRNRLGWKHSALALSFIDLRSMTWPAVRRCLRDALDSADAERESPPQVRLEFARNQEPVLINRYRREYWTSKCGRIRITIDTDQRFWSQLHAHRPILHRPSPHTPKVIVEAKFAAVEARLAADCLADIPIRASRNSKYMVGTLAGFVGW
jgi:hypothetical protein